MTRIDLNVAGTGSISVDIGAVVIAGFTGRDENAVRRHVDELAAAGIAAPTTVPEFYVVPADLLTTSAEIVVDGDETSGEVEPVVFVTSQGTFIGAGSDHTDRERERDSIASAKRACSKVASTDVVALASIESRLDELVLRSTVDGVRYQEAPLRELLPLSRIVEQAIACVPEGENVAVFCGTVPLEDGMKFADRFSGALLDRDGTPLSTYSYGIKRRARK